MKLADILHSGSAHILSSTSEHPLTRVSAFSDSPQQSHKGSHSNTEKDSLMVLANCQVVAKWHYIQNSATAMVQCTMLSVPRQYSKVFITSGYKHQQWCHCNHSPFLAAWCRYKLLVSYNVWASSLDLPGLKFGRAIKMCTSSCTHKALRHHSWL